MTGRTETFGGVVAERMAQRGVSRKELAAVIHRTESQLSLLLRDRVGTPTPDVVGAIAGYLGLDETRLVRLIGYLSSVPEGSEGLVIREEDARYRVCDLLGGLNAEGVAAVEQVAEAIARLQRPRGRP